VTSVDRRTALRKRYLRLGLGELAAATAFALVGATIISPRLPDGDARLAFWSALVPLLAILIQAGGYWLLARRWVGRAGMPEPLARLYRGLRVVDVALLLGGLGGIIGFAPPRPVTIVLAAGVWLFGVLEFGNYFVVRLAYPAHRWFAEVGRWRTPRLVLDFTHRG
jgi:hypothetical protein